MHISGVGFHPLRESLQQEVGGIVVLQQAVALQEQLVIGLDMGQVRAVDLGQDEVHVFAALVAGIVDQGRVERRDHHDREQADVFRKTGIGLGAPAEHFLPAPAD